jgi:predicted aspartyl protease
MAYDGRTEAHGELRLPVRVYDPEGRRSYRVSAMVDTGAHWCAVHPEIIHELGLRPRGETELDTAVGRTKTRMYIVRVEVPGVFDGLLSAAENQSVNHRFILGRQFLLGLKLKVNWKTGEFTVAKA